jgi:hypothetical protein
MMAPALDPQHPGAVRWSALDDGSLTLFLSGFPMESRSYGSTKKERARRCKRRCSCLAPSQFKYPALQKENIKAAFNGRRNCRCP